MLKDLCGCLGIADHKTARRQLETKAKGVVSNHPLQTPGGMQDVTIISEQGMYLLLMQSRKPEAVEFQLWVTGEVLPSIRKYGGYVNDDILNDTDKLLDLAIKLREERDRAIRTKAEIGSRREATAMATASVESRRRRKLEIQLDTSKEWATVKRAEIALGRKFSWRELKRVSGKLGVQPRKVFDENYGTVNSYHASVWMEAFGVDVAELP